jgi:hypothetical protein
MEHWKFLALTKKGNRERFLLVNLRRTFSSDWHKPAENYFLEVQF